MRIVYGLHDGSGDIRYVGMTSMTLTARLRAHRKRARRGDQTDRSIWIRSVLESGGWPVAVELERGEWTLATGNERERFWIAKLLHQGAALTNMTSGGAGASDPPERTRRAIADGARSTHTGRVRPDSTGQAISASLLRHYSEHPETREKIAASKRGKKHTDAMRQKLSESIRRNRQKCSCGMESSATGITRHQQATGHAGREAIEQP